MAACRDRVFLSSALGDLRRVRERVTPSIEGLGFDVFDFVRDMPATSRSPLLQIEHEIINSDVVVVLVGLSSGTLLGSEPVSFTGKEVQIASQHGKEIKLYVRSGQRYGTELALLHLPDFDIGISHSRFRKIEDLLAQVSRDLREWRRRGHKTRNKRDELLLSRIFWKWPRPSKGGQRQDLVHLLAEDSEFASQVDAFIRGMAEDRLAHRYGEVWENGTAFFAAFPRVRLRPPLGKHERQALALLIPLLSHLENAASFRGQLRDNNGALVLAKARLQAWYYLGDWRGYAGAASELSSIYYMLGMMKESKRWNDIALDKLEAQSLEGLKVGTLSIRASVLRFGKLSKPKEVGATLNEALWLAESHAPGERGLLLSQLGGWEMERGRIKAAQDHLKKALDLVQHVPPLWVRAAREWGRYLHRTGEHEEFLRIAAKVQELCRRHSLLHQQQRWAQVFKNYRPPGWP